MTRPAQERRKTGLEAYVERKAAKREFLNFVKKGSFCRIRIPGLDEAKAAPAEAANG